MKKFSNAMVMVLVLAASALVGCKTTDTRLGAGGTKVSGSAGAAGATDAAPELPQCSEALGTAALVEQDIPGLAQFGLSSPVPLVRLMMAQSGCFQLVDRGQAMQRIRDERALSESGELREDANMGGGQLAAADYLITPDVIFQDADAGGVGGGAGALIPGMLGGVLGGLKTTKIQAETMLTLTNARSGVQEALAVGSAQKSDIAWGAVGVAGVAGAAGGGYGSTDVGKVVAAAFLDSYNKLVLQVRAMRDR
ncbi:hypothetical protein D3OALGA1CA_378 [Olavius algarvensis associated proteobacterium Delta 3]|nr:hypothetical protein D3OALGA1CA_378 [Olavius algarvensis associated proteobacterium Delta 3]